MALPEEIVLRLGLRVGQEVDESELAGFEAETLEWRVREAALLLLSYRPRSEHEVRERLLRKAFPSELIEPCIEKLRASRLLDDSEFARAFARERLRNRPSGRRRLLSELRARGVSAADAEAAIDDAREAETGSESELDLARRAAARFRRRPGEETQRARRRLIGFLGRRGFDGETIRQVGRELSL